MRIIFCLSSVEIPRPGAVAQPLQYGKAEVKIMFYTLMPFVCMGTGLLLGTRSLPERFYKTADLIATLSLILLMFVIGGNVGTNDQVISEIGVVGLRCIVTCFCAVMGSVAVCAIIEKFFVPLGKYQELLSDDTAAVTEAEKEADSGHRVDPLLIIIIVSVFLGILVCYLLNRSGLPWLSVFLDKALAVSLIVLYTSVGIGMGQQKSVFLYMKKVGFKVLLFVLGVFAGSILGGALSTLITGMPLNYAVISTSGVGYYSLTGATMLSRFGAEAGVYGFMVNVFRDIFTILLLPLYVRLNKSAAIASGGAGCMDTMLVPITRAAGREIGLIALIVGIVLTFGVPIMLPILCGIL
jgi:uncharacterized membrane protein YbjE (DUF340 family)